MGELGRVIANSALVVSILRAYLLDRLWVGNFENQKSESDSAISAALLRSYRSASKLNIVQALALIDCCAR